MAFQFPADPLAQPEVTFGDITYKWDGEKWVVEGANSPAPDLQAVTDQGDKTTNGATFNGTVRSFTDETIAFGAGPGPSGPDKIRIQSDGTIYATDGINPTSVNATYALDATDGSATFAKQITAAEGYALAQLPALP